MKHLSIIFICCINSALAYGQFFSSAQVVVGKDAVVSVNSEMVNNGQLTSEGNLHLRKGLLNQGELSLNGKVVFDGQGNQFLESTSLVKANILVLAQQGKVTMRTPITIEKSLVLQTGIIEANDNNAVTISDNASVIGASDVSHIKGYVHKSGDDAFEFPIGDGSTLHLFSISKPQGFDEIKVGYINQRPDRLTSKLSADIGEISGESYWEVKGLQGKNTLNVSIKSNEVNHKLLQLRDQQWNLTAGNYSESTLSAQAILSGTTYFTVGTQMETLSEKADVSVYPNPSLGSFEVKLKGFLAEENIRIDISDLNGRILSTQSGKVKTLANKYNFGQETTNGNYILRVLRTEKEESFQQNVLINR